MDGSGFDPGFYPPMPGSYGPYMGYPPFPMPGPSFAPHYGSFGPPEVPFTNEVEKVTNVKGKKKTGPLKCDVCDMTMNSQSTYDVHLTGRIHTRNLAIKKGDFPDAKLFKGKAKKKSRLPIIFETQSQSTRGPVSIENYFRKCEVCELYLNSEAQWDVHIAGSKHTKALLLSKTKFNPSNFDAVPKPKSPSPAPKSNANDPPPITVTLPRGIIVVDSERHKFACDYCNNKLLNSIVQIEQHMKSYEHLKRSGARFDWRENKERERRNRSPASPRKDRRDSDRHKRDERDRRHRDKGHQSRDERRREDRDDRDGKHHHRSEARRSKDRSEGERHRRDSKESKSRDRRDSKESKSRDHKDSDSKRHRRNSDSKRHHKDLDVSSKHRSDGDVSDGHRRESEASSSRHLKDKDSDSAKSKDKKRANQEDKDRERKKHKRKREKRSEEKDSNVVEGSDEKGGGKRKKLKHEDKDKNQEGEHVSECACTEKNARGVCLSCPEKDQSSKTGNDMSSEKNPDPTIKAESEERWSDEERFYSKSKGEDSCDDKEGIVRNQGIKESSCRSSNSDEESVGSGSQERDVERRDGSKERERKFELFEFLDQAYSGRRRPQMKTTNPSEKSRKRRARERRRAHEEAMEDRWETGNGQIKDIKSSFVKGGVIKF